MTVKADASFEAVRTERLRLLGLLAELRSVHGESTTSRRPVEALPDPDRGDDPVSSLLEGAHARLTRETIEIGVFGLVNRGKSTIVNALLRQEVSPMRITPETAVPVWVESAASMPRLVFTDGSEAEVEDRDVARFEATQRGRKRRVDADLPRVQRLILPIQGAWLPDGVRIIDTPGLADPSLVDEYEDLTRAEIRRLSVAVFVLVSPPGVDESERQIMQSLAEDEVDKVIFVCNFHSMNWDDPSRRDQIVGYVRDVINSGLGDGSTAKVVCVNARSAWQAVADGDESGESYSGITELRDELSSYLEAGAFERQLWVAKVRMAEAGQWIDSALADRVALAQDPSGLDGVRRKCSERVAESEDALARLEADVERHRVRIVGRVETIVLKPFTRAISKLDAITRRSEVDGLDASVRMACEASVSDARRTLDDELGDLRERLRVEIYRTFGRDQPVVGSRSARLELAPPPSMVAGRGGGARDMAGFAAGIGGVTAVGGALIGGTIAGGVGIALLAAGPVGWLIGAGIGATLGLLAGAGVGAAVGSGSLPSEQRQALRHQISEQAAAAKVEVRRIVDDECERYREELRIQIRSFRQEVDDELDLIERFRGDEQQRRAIVEQAEALRLRLAGVQSGLRS